MGITLNWRDNPMYYAPNESVGRVGDPQAVIAEQYRQQMQGYAPVSAVSAPYGVPNAPQVQHGGMAPADYSGYGQTLQAASDSAVSAMRGDLEAELAANTAKIAELKRELAQIQGGDRLAADELDMKLAANRARIGDMANSIYHQGRPDQRKLVDLREKESKQYKINDLNNQLRMQMWMYNNAESTQDREKIKLNIDALNSQILQNGGTPISVSLGNSGNGGAVSSITPAKLKVEMDDVWEKGPDGNQYLKAGTDKYMLASKVYQVDPNGENKELQDKYRAIREGKTFSDYQGEYNSENFQKLVAEGFNSEKNLFKDEDSKKEIDKFYNKMKYKTKEDIELYEKIRGKDTIGGAAQAGAKLRKALADLSKNRDAASDVNKKEITLYRNNKPYKVSVSYDPNTKTVNYVYNGKVIHSVYKG